MLNATVGKNPGKWYFPVPPVFNDLQSSKLPVHPFTGLSARLSGWALPSQNTMLTSVESRIDPCRRPSPAALEMAGLRAAT